MNLFKFAEDLGYPVSSATNKNTNIDSTTNRINVSMYKDKTYTLKEPMFKNTVVPKSFPTY